MSVKSAIDTLYDALSLANCRWISWVFLARFFEVVPITLLHKGSMALNFLLQTSKATGASVFECVVIAVGSVALRFISSPERGKRFAVGPFL